MENMDELEARMTDGAVKVYSDDRENDFPVLKAFQQYIEKEQAKSRRRIIWICFFFSFLLTVVISVFVVLLIFSTSRNQTLNDRLVEYAMGNRQEKDSSTRNNIEALTSLTRKLDDLKASINTVHAGVDRPVEYVVKTDTEKPAQQTAEAREIERLKALLLVEKEKAALEREKTRQAELEAYRRKHYPELYEERNSRKAIRNSREIQRQADDAEDEIEEILNDAHAISYFDDDEDEKTASGAVPSTKQHKTSAPSLQGKEASQLKFIKDDTGNSWQIPVE